MKLWVVGQFTNDGNGQWVCEGVFDNQEKAESICVNKQFFVGPVILNEPLASHNIMPWPGQYSPIATT